MDQSSKSSGPSRPELGRRLGQIIVQVHWANGQRSTAWDELWRNILAEFLGVGE